MMEDISPNASSDAKGARPRAPTFSRHERDLRHSGLDQVQPGEPGDPVYGAHRLTANRITAPLLNQEKTNVREETEEIPPSAAQLPQPTTIWRISWQSPTAVLVLFISSILMSLAHHIYYQKLDGTFVQSEDQQTWAIRIGTGLAFLTKTSLVAVLGIVASQHLWKTLREKAMTLRGIDDMFSIMSDPTAIFNPEVVFHAKMLTILAVISWVIPLIAIITPATLSVKSLMSSSVTNLTVPTVNFSDYGDWATSEGVGRIDGAGLRISRLFASVFTTNNFTPQPAPFPNSSYEISFFGPSYKCENLSDAVAEQNAPTWDTATWNYSSLQDVYDRDLGIPNPMFGVYRALAPTFMNNVILIWAAGYNSQWNNPNTQTMLVCQLYNSSYRLSMEFNNSIQSISPISIDLVNPVAGGLEKGWLGFEYPELGTYWVTHILFSNLLVANITIGATGKLNFGGTGLIPLVQSGLMDCPEIYNTTLYNITIGTQDSLPPLCLNGTLAAAIEELSRLFVYSTISFSPWMGKYNSTVRATVSSPSNLYSYNRATLLSAYLAALGVALLCIVVGGIALFENGVTSSTLFSSVLLTTRNRELDDLAKGYCLGSIPLPDKIAGVRLRFGSLEGEGGGKHTAFGFERSVLPLKKGETYY